MFGAVARKISGSSNERRIRSSQPRVAEINALEQELEALSDEALRARTDAFRAEVADGKSLDELLVPAFATVHGLDDEQRKQAYDCDVSYGTNNELGFDYLRDNMKYRLEDMVQRGHIFAIVDEGDSILVDEGRTPVSLFG